jgi:hypothetical protein
MGAAPIIQQCSFIAVTDLVPEDWRGWFWGLISDSAPFSWGDNNRTMVTASRFYDHCKDRLDDPEDFDITQEDVDAFLEKIEDLGETMYIDLEN